MRPTRKLSIAVVHAVARALGAQIDVPQLRDARLQDVDVAQHVVNAAAYHAVLPLLWAAVMRDPETSPALRSTVQREYLPFVARGLRLERLLGEMSDALTETRLPFAVFKGAALSLGVYPTPQLRVFSDIDLLINRQDLDKVEAAFSDIGLIGRGKDFIEQRGRDYGENEYTTPLGTVDAHWHIMREAVVREGFAVDTGAMLARAQRLAIGERAIPVLDRADALIAVATHACFDGAYRLGWLVDLALTLRDPRLDWAVVQQRCVQTRTALPVQLLIDRAEQALGPSGRSPLIDGPWRRAVKVLSTVRPAQRSFRQRGRGGIAYRATRSSTGPSLAQLWRLSVDEVVVPILTDPNTHWRQPLPP